jgi:hypothetical protein
LDNLWEKKDTRNAIIDLSILTVAGSVLFVGVFLSMIGVLKAHTFENTIAVIVVVLITLISLGLLVSRVEKDE